MNFVYSDGGRTEAGYKGTAGDCATRAIAIATNQSYETVYQALRKIEGKTVRNGTSRKTVKQYMTELGWKWVALMGIGTGCKVHLRKEELPTGRLICSLSKHFVAVVDGMIYDTFDCSRNGNRCVYGYWYKS